ncbi:MAG: hypothetical protein AAFP26_02825 [Planctomycetota bacterium]
MNKFAFAVAIAAPVALASAQTVFEQAPGDGAGGFAGTVSDEAGGFFDVRQADNFSLSEATTITGAAWSGFEESFFSPDFPGNIAGFSVEFFTAAGGVPDSSVFQADFLLADLSQTILSPGVPGLTLTVAEWEASFASFDLAAGDYFFAVNVISVNGTANDDSFVWNTSIAGDGAAATETGVGSGAWAANANDQAFAIRGVPVPTPAVAGLFGAAGLLAARRRR